MVKCESCSLGKCNNQYVNRDLCEDPKTCTCTCQESEEATAWKMFGSIAAGVAAFGGGIAIITLTGGLGAVPMICGAIGGSALTGAGASSAINSISKKVSGERMTLGDYAKDVGVGALTGAITGPIGAAGGAITTSAGKAAIEVGVKAGAAKLACRSATGAVTGLVSAAIQEATSEESFKAENLARGVVIGALTGGVCHASSNVSKASCVSESGLGRAITRGATTVGASAAIDAGEQLATTGKVDGKRVLINVGVNTSMQATALASRNAVYAKNGGKEAFLVRNGVRRNCTEEQFEEIQRQEQELNKDPELQGALEEDLRWTNDERQLNQTKSELREKLQRVVESFNETVNEVTTAQNEQSRTSIKQDLARLQSLKNRLNEEIKSNNQALKQYEGRTAQRHGDANLHALRQDRTNQVAGDLPPRGGVNPQQGRGSCRAIYEQKNGTWRASHVIQDHDYNSSQDIRPIHGTYPLIVVNDYGVETDP